MVPAKFDALTLAPGDAFVMRTGGGGGWGSPFQRDPALVLRDVRVSLLTIQQARDAYGVAITADPLRVDQDETARLRTAPYPEAWIDRGKPQRAPGPGDVWVLSRPPEPWPNVSYRDVGLSEPVSVAAD
jgi:hypothetical protein